MFKALFRKQMQEIWQVYTTGRKGQNNSDGKKKVRVGFIVLYVFCFISLGFAFLGMSHMMAGAILGNGADWLYFSVMGIMAFAMGFLGSVFSTSTALYSAKDNEFLLSLPIKPIHILVVRMIGVYIVGLLFEVVVLLPALIVYCIQCGPSILAVLYSVILIFVMNAFVLVFSAFFGWIVAWVSSKLKNNSFMTVLISIVLIGGYYVFYFNVQNILNDLVSNLDNIEKIIRSWIYPFYAFGKASCGDTLSFIMFTVIVAALLALTCIILSKNYNKIISANFETNSSKKKLKSSDIVRSSSNGGYKKALLRKEFKRLTSSATYMLNCGLGCLFAVGVSVYLIIQKETIQAVLIPLIEAMDIAEYIPIIVLAACILFTSFFDFSAPSVSLEGSRIWILRTSPCNATDILYSKILMHQYITWPCMILVSIVAGWVAGLNFETCIPITLAVIVVVGIEARFGIMLDLKNVKLDWTNEVVPIKQSLQVLIALFIGIPLAAVLCGPYFIKGVMTIGAQGYIYVVIAILVVTSRIMDKWITTKGSAIWNEL